MLDELIATLATHYRIALPDKPDGGPRDKTEYETNEEYRARQVKFRADDRAYESIVGPLRARATEYFSRCAPERYFEYDDSGDLRRKSEFEADYQRRAWAEIEGIVQSWLDVGIDSPWWVQQFQSLGITPAEVDRLTISGQRMFDVVAEDMRIRETNPDHQPRFTQQEFIKMLRSQARL